MKGEITIYKNIFGEEETPKTGDEKQRPRNVLMPDRDLLLMYRCYYLLDICRMRYDDAMQQLEKEFFIVGVRIGEVLADNADRLREITKGKPTAKQLEKLYPHINWKYNPR